MIYSRNTFFVDKKHLVPVKFKEITQDNGDKVHANITYIYKRSHLIVTNDVLDHRETATKKTWQLPRHTILSTKRTVFVLFLKGSLLRKKTENLNLYVFLFNAIDNQTSDLVKLETSMLPRNQ